MTDPADLTAAMVAPAEQLAAIVHNDGTARQVAEITDRMTHTELVALAVVLAAATNPMQPFRRALAWTDMPQVRKTGQLKPHGDHAAFQRHKKNGTDPCDACRAGERAYNTRMKRAAAVRRAAA